MGIKAEELLERMILISGPPRSGTTFAIKSLSHHPAFVAAIDDHVYECWGLYHYRKRSGLIQQMRTRSLSRGEAKRILSDHLFSEGCLKSAARSDKTKDFPGSGPDLSLSDGFERSALDADMVFYKIPLETINPDRRLCLKSPEISFVMPELAQYFPEAKFIMVYRPVIEIAESMYRMGNLVKRFPIYHRWWVKEKKESGEFLPPPGIPGDWNTLWQNATDFQRCVIYATSYIRAILQGVVKIGSDRYFLYNHKDIQKNPDKIFDQMAEFLAVNSSGFQEAKKLLKTDDNRISTELTSQYAEIDQYLSVRGYMHQMDALRSYRSRTQKEYE